MGEHDRRKFPRNDDRSPVKIVLGGKEYTGVLINVSKTGALLQLDHKILLFADDADAAIEIRFLEKKESLKGTLIRAFLGDDKKLFCAAHFPSLEA